MNVSVTVAELTAERFTGQWWGSRLAARLGTDRDGLRVFDDCDESVAQRRRLLAAAVEGWKPRVGEESA